MMPIRIPVQVARTMRLCYYCIILYRYAICTHYPLPVRHHGNLICGILFLITLTVVVYLVCNSDGLIF